ncbi:microcystin LR degradation protein MlrC-like protein [Zhengella mangrovi]|uniref:Microcystinase C n=1 Tax=Zhengella mangrovi TaxID=1982044 RepID=A0A2G1QID9_9HYPH|nr:M81 family metallopeptidase [Zhengella mangrovi]PHP65307.1 microcystin LR degradation protein MlrC-like protein [Zhengella mangrovi]
MKVFIAGLSTETNSFSPLPTGYLSFAEAGIRHGDATAYPKEYFTAPLHIWRAAAQLRGWEVVESLSAHAQPAGPTVRKVYEDFRDEIITDLTRCGGADIVLLALHGAMIADGYDDCEGDLIAHCRAVAPDAVIGGLLDPHCHLTETMLTQATLLVAFKEYPHVDIPERAEDLFRLAGDTAAGTIRPVMRDFDCRMILAMPTPSGPMRAFVDAMAAREGKDGILSLSIAHGFPWGDHPRTGTRAFAIVDGDEARAASVAEDLGRSLHAIRHQLLPDMADIDRALDMAQAEAKGPVVLADVSDNAGGGAPSDATFLLRAMIGRGMTSVATGLFWDPVAVRICREAGEGATLPLRLGGKCGPMSGDPLDLTVTVRKCASGLTQRFGTLPAPMGEAVWIEADGIDIVINDVRSQTFHPEAFEQLGIDLSKRRYVCVKSSNHYQAGFNPIAARVIPVATPGAITPDYANIPYTKRARDYWPAIPDPLS